MAAQAAYFAAMFGVSLAATLSIELAVAWIMGVKTARGICIVLLANILTNPAAVLLNWIGSVLCPEQWSTVCQIPIEIVVVAVESLVFWSFSAGQGRGKLQEDSGFAIRHPIRLAIVANGISWLAGVVLL